jgi:glycine cleavage system transcriptional repressor
MGKQLVISVMSKDRPGIIADIATVIYDLGGDLADLNQSVLGGYFTMLLIAEFEKNITPADLFSGFSNIESETKIEANIKEMEVKLEVEKKLLPRETFIVTVQGDNRKGLVKAMGDFFYGNNINVLDLATTREDDKYTMIFQVDLTSVPSMEAFRDNLNSLADQEKLNLVIQHNDIFMATNEVGTQLEILKSD